MARPRRRGNSKPSAKFEADKNNFQDAAEIQADRRGRGKGKNNGRRNSQNKVYPINTNSYDNDPRWYGVNPQLLKDAASLPFARSTGYPIMYEPSLKVNGSAQSQRFAASKVPGVWVTSWMPSLGMAKEPTDAVNVAANALYSFVRHANSGHANYDAPNLMSYILALDSAYAWYSTLTRVYGIMSNYQMMNRYIPQALVYSMGFDWQDLSISLANFRQVINQYAYKLASLALPVDIYYITRHVWMNENVYKDAETSKAQYYIYRQEYYYQWIEAQEDVLGILKLISRPGEDKTLPGINNTRKAKVAKLQDIAEFCNTLIDPIIGSEDMNIMSGDILKAFGDGNLFKVHGIDETYTVEPVMNKEVMMQFENTTTMPASISSGSVGGNIFDKPASSNTLVTTVEGSISEVSGINQGFLYESVTFDVGDIFSDDWEPAGSITGGFTNYMPFIVPNKQLINMHIDNPTPEDVMVATRMMNFGTALEIKNGVAPGREQFEHGSCGSEVPLFYEVWSFVPADEDSDSDVGSPWLKYCQFGTYNYMEYDRQTFRLPGISLQNLLQLDQVVSTFDWHPRISYVGLKISPSTNYSSTMELSAPNFDYENVAIVNRDTLNQMHHVALLSELNCQRLGAFTAKV